MNSLMILWVTLLGASAILGGIAFVVLRFTNIPKKPSLSGGAILAWAGALAVGGIFIASFSGGTSPYNIGMESRITVLIAGLGQFLAAFLIGFMAAGLTGLLPETKRPNFVRATLLMTTIALTFSAIGQLAQK